MIDNKCGRCKGLCEEFSKFLFSKKTVDIGECVYKGCNFQIRVVPSYGIYHLFRKNTLSTYSEDLHTIDEVVDYLLDWDRLQLEDAIRLTKVTKNV